MLHALHVSSGFSVLPLRVWIVTLPLERHQMRPQALLCHADEVTEQRRVRPRPAVVGGVPGELEDALGVRRRELEQRAGHAGLGGERVGAD